MNDQRLRTLLAEPSTDAADDAHRRARVERSRSEMLQQAPAIAATLRNEAEARRRVAAMLAERGLRRAAIVGCGDSWFAGIAARFAWERVLGIPTEAAQALDWAHYASDTVDRHTLVIGISAGGNTPAVIAALAAARARGAVTLGLSNTAGSAIVSAFDAGLVVHATRRGWPTQSSTAAVALLCALAADIAEAGRSGDASQVAALRRDLDGLPALVDAVTQRCDAEAAAVAARFAAARLILFTGAGPHFAAAAFGAAKVKELSPIHAVALPLEEYHHYRSQKRGDPLFLVAPDDASHPRALDTALVSEAVGGRTVALVPEGESQIAARVETAWALPVMRPELAAIAYSVPLHLFAYHFAMARFARGLGYPAALEA